MECMKPVSVGGLRLLCDLAAFKVTSVTTPYERPILPECAQHLLSLCFMASAWFLTFPLDAAVVLDTPFRPFAADSEPIHRHEKQASWEKKIDGRCNQAITLIDPPRPLGAGPIG
jgi:hypothetical protein